jgi:hypothetical protein
VLLQLTLPFTDFHRRGIVMGGSNRQHVSSARDAIDRVAGAIMATHPDFRYQHIAGPEELGNAGRIRWVSGRPGEALAYARTDFISSRDGRIAALYLFFDKLAGAGADTETLQTRPS